MTVVAIANGLDTLKEVVSDIEVGWVRKDSFQKPEIAFLHPDVQEWYGIDQSNPTIGYTACKCRNSECKEGISASAANDNRKESFTEIARRFRETFITE